EGENLPNKLQNRPDLVHQDANVFRNCSNLFQQSDLRGVNFTFENGSPIRLVFPKQPASVTHSGPKESIPPRLQRIRLRLSLSTTDIVIDMRPNIDPALIASLNRHVDCLAGLIGPRPLARFAAFEAAATYVERELTNAGHKVSRETYAIGNKNVSNIVAEF